MTATRAAANLAAATTYSASENSKRLQTELTQLKRKRPPRSNRAKKNQNKKEQRNDNEKKNHSKSTPDDKRNQNAGPTTTDLSYCYLHGYQKSHTSADCKVLKGDKNKYTNEMRRAKNPKQPSGGSTKVNGQPASPKPKVVKAKLWYIT
jgi:hypothetical protein